MLGRQLGSEITYNDEDPLRLEEVSWNYLMELAETQRDLFLLARDPISTHEFTVTAHVSLFPSGALELKLIRPGIETSYISIISPQEQASLTEQIYQDTGLQVFYRSEDMSN